MKKVQKILALLLAVSMFAGMSTGCSTGNSTSKGSASTGSTASSGAAAGGEKVTITYAQWGNDTETAATKAVADKFNASQDHIKVEIMQVDHESYITKLNAMATAGQLPDTGIMSEAGVLTFANNGMLYDISKMYDGSDSKPLDSLTFKLNGTPVAYSAANEVLNTWYNIDLLNEVCKKQNLDPKDFAPPATADKAWTWDQFVKVAKTLTLDTSGRNANDPKFDPKNIAVYGCSVNTLPWQMEVWALSNGSGYYSADGSKCTISDDAAAQAFQAVADLYLVDHCAPQPGASTTALSTTLGTQKVVMATDGAWNVGTFLGPDAKFKYGVGVLPYFKNKVTICTGGPNVVFKTTKHPEEAMTWLKWYMQEENSWDLIKAGTWMPILKSWYTDSAKTDKWINNPHFPDHDMYKSAVVDYARDNSKSASWYYVSGTDVFNTTLDTVLSHVWTGDMKAKDALGKYYNDLNDAFESGKSK